MDLTVNQWLVEFDPQMRSQVMEDDAGALGADQP